MFFFTVSIYLLTYLRPLLYLCTVRCQMSLITHINPLSYSSACTDKRKQLTCQAWQTRAADKSYMCISNTLSKLQMPVFFPTSRFNFPSPHFNAKYKGLRSWHINYTLRGWTGELDFYLFTNFEASTLHYFNYFSFGLCNSQLHSDWLTVLQTGNKQWNFQVLLWLLQLRLLQTDFLWADLDFSTYAWLFNGAITSWFFQ